MLAIIQSHENPMSEQTNPIAVTASEAPARTNPSNYPEPFASRMVGREKRPLGDPIWSHKLWCQPNTLGSQCSFGSSSRPHQARRVYLYPARVPNAAHRRRAHPTFSGNVRRLQGGHWQWTLPDQRNLRGSGVPRIRRQNAWGCLR